MDTFGIDADALRVSESDCSKSAIVTNTTQKVKRRIICMASAAQDMQIAKDPRDAACSGARVSLALASPSSSLRERASTFASEN
jgi:hypothetical protein